MRLSQKVFGWLGVPNNFSGFVNGALKTFFEISQSGGKNWSDFLHRANAAQEFRDESANQRLFFLSSTTHWVNTCSNQ